MIYARVGNTFLIAFALDAAVSVADELLKREGIVALGPVRNAAALWVLMVAAPTYLLMAMTPRLPLRIFLPPIGLLLWLSLGGAPMQLFATGDALSLYLSAIQLAASGLAFWLTRLHSAGAGWLLSERDSSLRGYAPLRFALVGGSTLASVPLLLVAYLAVAASSWAHVTTAGFLDLDLQGITLEERRFEKDGRELVLVGMMHIGESEAYDALYESFATESTVVLEEGVTDDAGLLDLPLSYRQLAGSLGLSQQRSVSEYFGGADVPRDSAWPHFRHADLDMSDFSPQTIAFLAQMAEVFQASSPWTAVQLSREISSDAATVSTVLHDIIERRNQRLLEEIVGALPDYDRIIVPWGALHLPFIEAQMIDRGFELTHSEERRLVHWATLGLWRRFQELIQ